MKNISIVMLVLPVLRGLILCLVRTVQVTVGIRS